MSDGENWSEENTIVERGREFGRVDFKQRRLLLEGRLDFGLSEENHQPHKDLVLFHAEDETEMWWT